MKNYRLTRYSAPGGFADRVMENIRSVDRTGTPPAVEAQGAGGRVWVLTAPYAAWTAAAIALLFFGAGFAASLLVTAPVRRGIHDQKVMVRFSLYAPAAQEVSLAGDFNNWNPEHSALSPQGNGVWTLTLPLPSGRYKNMFLVDGKTWTPDPSSPRHSDDGFGGRNSILDLG